MPKGVSSHFFLGANSPTGFFSLYDGLIDLKTADSVYIIKGGPGCGKSTFMRLIAEKLTEAGANAEYIMCSSDPSSVDGVVFEGLKTAFVDGTSPHIVEPQYPYVVERYINLGEFYDTEGLKEHREDIIEAFDTYRKFYQSAYSFIRAARSMEDDMFNAVVSSTVLDKILKRTKGIIQREIRGKGDGGGVKKRLLSAISPDGMICRFDTARAICSRIFEINDNYGLAHFMLTRILEAAQKAGYGCYALYCPMNPSTKIEHVLIPGLDVGFVSSSSLYPYDAEPFRRIRLDACIDPELMRSQKKRLKFAKKTQMALLDEAVASIKTAKLHHDRLEKLFNPYVDFGAVYTLADNVAKNLLEKLD